MLVMMLHYPIVDDPPDVNGYINVPPHSITLYRDTLLSLHSHIFRRKIRIKRIRYLDAALKGSR